MTSSYRLALISDIHGNELALARVLRDIRDVGVDQIACLGDVATLGPRPREVLEMVKSACDFFILGNHDEYLLEMTSLREHSTSALILGAVEQCRGELSPADLDFVRGFQRTTRISVAGAGSMLLFHGSPSSNNCDLLCETSESELEQQLLGHPGVVMAGGHTHVQMLRQHRGRLLVNPGSVGLPFETFVGGRAPTLLPHAEYAIVQFRGGDVSVALHRLPLNRAALAQAASAWHGPMAPYLVQQYCTPD